jgi:hypothetical protein
VCVRLVCLVLILCGLPLQVVMARPHLLRPQGGEALRRGLEARQAAAEGVKLRASRGLAAAAAEAEEEVGARGRGESQTPQEGVVHTLMARSLKAKAVYAQPTTTQ